MLWREGKFSGGCLSQAPSHPLGSTFNCTSAVIPVYSLQPFETGDFPAASVELLSVNVGGHCLV